MGCVHTDHVRRISSFWVRAGIIQMIRLGKLVKRLSEQVFALEQVSAGSEKE